MLRIKVHESVLPIVQTESSARVWYNDATKKAVVDFFGSGDGLSDEDVDAGYNAYSLCAVYDIKDFDGSHVEDVFDGEIEYDGNTYGALDSAMVLLKHSSDYNEPRHFYDVLSMLDLPSHGWKQVVGPEWVNPVTEDFSELARLYGSEPVVDTHESSASGFYPSVRHPLAWALLNDDVDMLERLHDGTVPQPEKPWLYTGWEEDIDAPEDDNGNYPYVYDMDTDYEKTFIDDWYRIVGRTDNQRALRKMFEYYPDFILCDTDWTNAFLAGYDKGLLLKSLRNLIAINGTDGVWPFVDGVSVDDMVAFLLDQHT